jgi:choline-sulfatase
LKRLSVVALMATLAACSRERVGVGIDGGVSASASAGAGAGASASASATPTPLPPPLYNVILLSIDSLRADTMPWAGYARDVAPRLTELSKRAVVYTHAYSISSFTSKSLPAMLASRYPSEMPRDGVFFTKYQGGNTMMCDVLAESGVPCVAGMAHAYLGKGYAGIDHGFAKWSLVPGITFDYNTDPFVTSQKLTTLAMEMLGDEKLTGNGDSDTSKRFFAWFHFMDPHDEYQSHKESPHFGSKLKDLYDEEVFYTDLFLGKLVDFVALQPWGKRTVIVVTSDHGEAFGEHSKWKHAQELYETHVRVPLLFVFPEGASAPAHRTIDTPRSAIDLAPTILTLLGAKPSASMHGVSLDEEIAGGEAKPRDVVCDLPQDEYNDKRRALIHDGWKLIAFGSEERFALYRLDGDPDEKVDLYAKEKDVAKDMVARFREVSKGIKDVAPTGGIPKH